MAITVSLLGTPTFNTTIGTKTVTATPAVGDLVIIITAHTGNTSTAAPTDNNSGGGGTYTLINSAVKATSADTMRIYVRDNLITSATSTVFTHAPAGTTTGGGLVVIDAQGMDKAGSSAVVKSAIQSNQAAGGTPAPVFGATPSTANAIIGAVFNASNPAGLTPRTNYTELFDSGYNNPITGLEVMSYNSGETSATITWGSTSATAFASIVVELDARVTHATTGTLTGQIGSVSGSAQRNAIHTTTGTLTGQIGSVSGAADREAAPVPHESTGALTGQGSVITGSADTAQVRTSSGALVGQDSIITGDADREPFVLPHTTEGTLIGQGATVSGSTTRFRAFSTSGTLTGQGSSIVGDADHVSNTHDSSGSIVGDGSIITGDAKNESGTDVVTGASARNVRQPSLVIVEVDGKEYRVPQSRLNAFLESIKVEAKADIEKTVKRAKKKKKQVVEQIFEQPVQIEIKSIPVNIIPKVSAQIGKVNTEISMAFNKAVQKYMQEMEDEEIILLSL